MKIEVLMSTYNGEKYIERQIESIFSQNIPNEWKMHLTVRDDFSSDKTSEILTELCGTYNIDILPSKKKLGFKNSFFELIKRAKDADYYFFSDQDDIWYDRKVKKMISIVPKALTLPVLVYSDLLMFGDKNGLYSKSRPIIRHDQDSAKTLAMRNVVTGAAMMINSQAVIFLRENGEELFSKIDYHDKLIAEVISNIGTFYYISDPLVKYRQHENNVTGKKLTGHAINRFNQGILQRKKVAQILVDKHEYLLKKAGNYEFMNLLANIGEYSYLNNLRIGVKLLGSVRQSIKYQGAFILLLLANKFKSGAK